MKPRFLSQLCTDKFISDRIKQKQHIVLWLDLTIISKTPKVNKETFKNYCKVINKSNGDQKQLL